MKAPHLVICAALCAVSVRADETYVIQPTPSLAGFARDLSHQVREKLGIEISVAEDAGNSQCAAAVSQGKADLALLTRDLTPEERVNAPDHHLYPIRMATQAVAVVVARPVWQSGVKAIKRDQVVNAYENRVKSWKELGGEDRPLQFFEPAHDRGPWEIFAAWAYGDVHKVPAVDWQVVNDGPDTQVAMQFSSGGVSIANLRWVDQKDVFALALVDQKGKPIDPTNENIASGAYPLSRPVFLIFAEEPVGWRRKVLQYIQGESGQKFIGNHEMIPQSKLDALATP